MYHQLAICLQAVASQSSLVHQSGSNSRTRVLDSRPALHTLHSPGFVLRLVCAAIAGSASWTDFGVGDR